MRTSWMPAFVALLLALGLGACGSPEEEASSAAYPPSLRWTSRPGAASYRVQAWSGLRLLFEETTADTVLPLTPALLRAMAPFDSCRIEVRVVEVDGAAASPDVFWVRQAPGRD